MADILYTVQDGETLGSIADAANTSVDFILDNNTPSELQLNGGQQLVVGVTQPADPYASGLPSIGSSNPDATALQEELRRVGYWPAAIGTGSLYGTRTQNSVRVFYQAQPGDQFPGNPNHISDQIGPAGWAHLRSEASGAFNPGTSEPAHNYTKVTYSGGVTINVRTRDMLTKAVQLLTAYSWSPYLTQGSYNPGVSASGGTHDGGGVFDVRTSTMTTNGQNLCVEALRKAGFAAWLRTPAEGFSTHIHAVAIGDRELSEAAHDQVIDYFAGRNGLANNGPDTGSSRPFPAWAATYKPSFIAAPGGGGGETGTPGTIAYSQIKYAQKGQHPSGNAACQGYARQALDILGYSHTYWVPGLALIAARETASNSPNWQINTSDSNARNVPELNGGGPAPDGYPGMCSRGCMQTIPQTFGTYHLAGTSLDIYNPVASMGAAIRYIRSRYGVSTSGSDLASKVQQADPNRPPAGY